MQSCMLFDINALARKPALLINTSWADKAGGCILRGMTKTPSSWPVGALPRLLNKECAAYYCCLSENTFSAHVRAGFFPAGKPITEGGRPFWDRVALDKIIDARFGTTQSKQVDLDRSELDAHYGYDQIEDAIR